MAAGRTSLMHVVLLSAYLIPFSAYLKCLAILVVKELIFEVLLRNIVLRHLGYVLFMFTVSLYNFRVELITFQIKLEMN